MFVLWSLNPGRSDPILLCEMTDASAEAIGKLAHVLGLPNPAGEVRRTFASGDRVDSRELRVARNEPVDNVEGAWPFLANGLSPLATHPATSHWLRPSL